MPYERTNRPPGRPRKDGTPAGSPRVDPEQPGLYPCPCGCGAYTATPMAIIATERNRSDVPFNDAPCCPVCHPDGWPPRVTGYGCEHGIWARRI